MNRRHFISGIAAAAGGSLLRPASISAAEGAPETTSVTLAKTPALCTAPQFIAENTDWRFLNELKRELKV